MRKWRVGTISMGISLIFLGIILFLSLFQGKGSFETLFVWWPLILVVLGIEITAYIFLAKQEQPYIKYDLFSIFIVGIIGSLGIVSAVLTSTGLMDKVQDVLVAEEHTFDLPEYVSENLSTDIKKVVLETGNQEINIEGNQANQVHIFGTYRTSVKKGEQGVLHTNQDYLTTKKVGDTLFIAIKDLPRDSEPFGFYSDINPTIIIPQVVELDVRGNDNFITLHPGVLKNHWSINSSADINVFLERKSDIEVSAKMMNHPASGNIKWDELDKISSDDNYNQIEVNGKYKLGKGLFQLEITDSQNVTLNVS